MTHTWGVTYWSTFLLTGILPLHQIYAGSGESYVRVEVFDRFERNMIFFRISSILCIGATGLLFFGSLDCRVWS